MELNQYFIDNYLTCGAERGNFVFLNCSNEVLNFAKENLNKGNEKTIPAVVSINKKQAENVKKLLDQYETDFQREIIASNYISSLIFCALFKNAYSSKNKQVQGFALENKNVVLNAKQFIQAVRANDQLKATDYVMFCPTSEFILYSANALGRIDLTFILKDMQNSQLQKAINGYLIRQKNISTKLFTNLCSLSNYFDQSGNIIQSPHDYLQILVADFIKRNINP